MCKNKNSHAKEKKRESFLTVKSLFYMRFHNIHLFLPSKQYKNVNT